jgi:hypothetical protein
MPEVKARRETPEKAWTRLQREFETAETPDCVKAVGMDAGDGYRIVATNGHWALCEMGKGQPGGYIGDTSNHQRVILNNPELHLALKRAATCAGPRNHCVGLVGLPEGIGVYSSDSEAEFAEIVEGPSFSGHFNIDVKYLEPVLGVWPMALFVHKENPHEHAVMLEPADNPQWRYIVMPLRSGTLEDAEERFKDYAANF